MEGYETYIVCYNCDVGGYYTIPFNQLRNDYVKDALCHRCKHKGYLK